MATETPARAMGWTSKGVLEVGKDADLVVLTPDLKVVQAFGGGAALLGLSSRAGATRRGTSRMQ
jgi:N-acetylglucosamine-6-phosphate deacetylase